MAFRYTARHRSDGSPQQSIFQRGQLRVSLRVVETSFLSTMACFGVDWSLSPAHTIGVFECSSNRTLQFMPRIFRWIAIQRSETTYFSPRSSIFSRVHPLRVLKTPSSECAERAISKLQRLSHLL